MWIVPRRALLWPLIGARWIRLIPLQYRPIQDFLGILSGYYLELFSGNELSSILLEKPALKIPLCFWFHFFCNGVFLHHGARLPHLRDRRVRKPETTAPPMTVFANYRLKLLLLFPKITIAQEMSVIAVETTPHIYFSLPFIKRFIIVHRKTQPEV